MDIQLMKSDPPWLQFIYKILEIRRRIITMALPFCDVSVIMKLENFKNVIYYKK